MAIPRLNIGASPNDKTGDSLRDAFGKVNDAIDQVNANTQSIAVKVDKAAGMGLSQNSFTNEQRDKLNGLEGTHWRGTFLSVSALQAALPTANAGDSADVDTGAGSDVQRYIWDASDTKWVQQGAATTITAAQVKDLYESNSDTNAFSDAERQKLGGLESGATKNATDAQLRDRSSHTGLLNWSWCDCTGSANQITLRAAFKRTSLQRGDVLRFRAVAVNTGSTTINLDELGDVAAVTVTGSPLPAGYIRTTVDTECRYDGIKWVVGRSVEIGSNANGNYWRFEDGTLKCQSGPITRVVKNTDSLWQIAWTLPAGYATAPFFNFYMAGWQLPLSKNINIQVYSPGISAATAGVFCPTGPLVQEDFTSQTFYFASEGRWY